MQRGPSWQAYSSTDSYKTPRILWKVHYSVHNSSETVPIQGQINPFYALTAHLLETHFNIIFLSTYT